MIHKILICLLFIPNICLAQNQHFTDIRNRLILKNKYDKFTRLGTRIHEQCHGLNNLLTNNRRRLVKNYNISGFYLLNDKEIYLNNPNTTMSRVAQKIPIILRGKFYRTYFQVYDRAWEKEPLYTVEEWVAYSNELESCDSINEIEESSILGAHEFAFYAISLLENADQDYIDFYKWNVERINRYSTIESDKHKLLLHHQDVKKFKDILVKTYGADWVNQYFPQEIMK